MAESVRTPPTALLIALLVALGLAVVLGLGVGAQQADYPTPFALSHTYALMACAELFVLLVVAPLACGRGCVGLLDLVVLWAMAAPAVVVGWWVSDCDAASVAASQGHVLAVAWLVAGALRVGGGERLRGWYWLVVGALSAGAPLAAFVVGDLMQARLTWLAALSPFWVVVRVSGPWQVGWEWAAPLAATVVVGSVLWLWPARSG